MLPPRDVLLCYRDRQGMMESLLPAEKRILGSVPALQQLLLGWGCVILGEDPLPHFGNGAPVLQVALQPHDLKPVS